MKIDNNIIDKLADLAKLEFQHQAKDEIVKDLNRILSFVEKLSELNTDDIDPLIYMNEDVNVLREDEIKQDITKKEALSNAPKKDSDYFKVPKVIG